MRFPAKQATFSCHGGKLKPSSLQPVLPLLPEVLPTKDLDKAKFILFKLKSCTGQPAGSTTYKKFVHVFEEGTPQQWIDLIRDVEEIWTQNSINGPLDRTLTVHTLLRGKSLTAFDTALEDVWVDPDPNVQDLVPLTMDHPTGDGQHSHGSLPSLRSRNPEAVDELRHEEAIQLVHLQNSGYNHEDQQQPSFVPAPKPGVQIPRPRNSWTPQMDSSQSLEEEDLDGYIHCKQDSTVNQDLWFKKL
jgi:hypothetical protein